MNDGLNPLGQTVIAVLFLGGAVQKLVAPEQVQAIIAGNGLPPVLVAPVAAFNLVAGLCLITGPRVRAWAILLACYCLFTAFFHWQLRADPWQMTIMVKNIAIAGGLVILAAQGPGRFVIWSQV